MPALKTVSAEIYSPDYFLQRCGGVEFFDRYKEDVLKPMMRLAARRADLKPGMKILDVGCGRGELTAHLAKRGFDVIGVDYAKDAIDVAQRFFPNCSFICGDLFQLGLKSHSFDRIFFLGTIEHMYDEEIAKIFGEFSRLLAPGGRVMVTTCTNSLYHKTCTYRIRRVAVRVLNILGIKLKAPSAPRSGEDLEMHINEQNFFSLRKHFSKDFWRISVEPRLNPKLCVTELYGESLPPDFPLRTASGFKRWVYRFLVRIPYLNLVITRANLVIVEAL